MGLKKNIYRITIVLLIVSMSIGGILLLDRHLSTRKDAKWALHTAIRENNFETVKKIIKQYPSLINENKYLTGIAASWADDSSCTPLSYACQFGNKDIIEFLVETGADVNKGSNVVNAYPVFTILRRRDYDLVWYLIENGADLSLTTDFDKTFPLAIVNRTMKDENSAEQEECLKLMKYAIEHDAPLKSAESTFYGIHSVFGMAARNNYPLIVEYFLEEELFDINERVDAENRTALMVAVQGGAYHVCELLLENGADQTIIDDNGKTAYDYAVESNNETLIALLNDS
ncbi:MAG: ankyrin repeat domain-containing protein [Clostridia bacterium]|nr:ankyrin repeat domain-containing protein [Clostridia bacterium]